MLASQVGDEEVRDSNKSAEAEEKSFTCYDSADDDIHDGDDKNEDEDENEDDDDDEVHPRLTTFFHDDNKECLKTDLKRWAIENFVPNNVFTRLLNI